MKLSKTNTTMKYTLVTRILMKQNQRKRVCKKHKLYKVKCT